MKYFYLMLMCLAFGCKEKKYHDQAVMPMDSRLPETVKEVLAFQQELNEEFKDPETSPLPDRYRKDFEGLDFFAPDSSFRVVAKFVRTPGALPFMMPTTTDRKSEEVLYGVAHFTLKGKACKLEIYQNQKLMLEEEYKDYLFLPFLDDTNGTETYSGGRYIDLSIPEGELLVIDFNKAYNPYCAYNKKYSCPLVPKTNTLDLKVTAGVKAFNAAHK
ncbi:MAG: DUF1684 domain-containing protein [Sediminicola sp.]|tara:strand:+ start:39245 stop:39892 length:648 start_codon:yes stop_codon:yes gene_type:complete